MRRTSCSMPCPTTSCCSRGILPTRSWRSKRRTAGRVAISSFRSLNPESYESTEYTANVMSSQGMYDVKYTETALQGAYIVDIEPIEDERGFFARSWCREEFAAHGLRCTFVQSNISFNTRKGTLRGMHYQVTPNEEAKLVRCTRGAIYDVIIDLRSQSRTCTQWVAVELTAANHRMLYIPGGFAHG